MLTEINYSEYYKALSVTDMARLQELFEVAATGRLPAAAIYIVELERAGYMVDLTDGEVWIDTGRKVVDCGKVEHFYSLLDKARELGFAWGWKGGMAGAAAGQGAGEVGR